MFTSVTSRCKLQSLCEQKRIARPSTWVFAELFHTGSSMAHPEQAYLDLLTRIINKGTLEANRAYMRLDLALLGHVSFGTDPFILVDNKNNNCIILLANIYEVNKVDKSDTVDKPDINNPSNWTLHTIALSIETKEHIAANGVDIFNVCEQILKKNERPYNIDGLVFTPTDLPVFAHYPNAFKNIKGKSVVWEKVLKWKPPEQNTIDFLVKEQQHGQLYTDEKTNVKYKA
jgi:hypothetical protein